jgi:exopolyphosphatase/guanosine-5'-triphosphate,3'-diphosphate pyrophosphatase
VTEPLAAALDIGSNSIHLLVARRGPDSQPVPVLDVSHQAGMGRVVDATGELGAAIREELRGIVGGYVDEARALGAGQVLLLGTEALRTASDTDLLVDALRARTGLSLAVIDRTSEGLLSLLGVTGGRVPRSLAVADIGGGSTQVTSTQVTVTHPDGQPVVGMVPVGSARLAGAHIHHDPVTSSEIVALRDTARRVIAGLDLPRPARAIIAGGSGTNVSRLLLRERTTPIDRPALAAALDLLRSHPAQELATRTGLSVRRVAQLAAGIAIGEALLDRLGLESAEVSDASLREGALIAAWAAGDDWLATLPEVVERRRTGRIPDPAMDGPDRAS